MPKEFRGSEKRDEGGYRSPNQSFRGQELADMIESGEEVPEALRHWFAEESLEKRPQDRKNGKECAVRTTIACSTVQHWRG